MARIDLSTLVDDEDDDAVRRPAPALAGPRSARLDRVAANPLNTRSIVARPKKITEIAKSMLQHGQLQPCTVVTRAAFLRIFPEHEGALGQAAYVQVTGGRRRAAAIEADLDGLDIVVKDDLAESRTTFVSATAAENLDREDLDPIEEAEAVALIVREAGSGKEAAARLGRTPPYVSQKLNLLKLVSEVQAVLRSGEIPVREVRDWHTLDAAGQLGALVEWQAARAGEEGGAEEDPAAETPLAPAGAPAQRRSMAAVAIKRLGGSPSKVALAIRSETSEEFIRELVQELLADLPDQPAPAD